jgi:acyl carrier protein
MKRIRIKLYKILRNIGLDRAHIHLFTIFDEELSLDWFDKTCYIYYLENSFNISIPDKDIPSLKTIDNTINYLYLNTYVNRGLE